jgi:D-alanyl-D-alanine carboxypeptidase/D-alanyl-D-alanine-endopeptidase (penicillin-binding protein 4)
LLLLLLLLLASADLPPAALQALRQANVPSSAISVQVTPLGSTTPRLAHRAQVSSNPASVIKLITTYAGLSLLGPDHTWRNRVYADGPIKDGVLQGNLILRGSGDPKLVIERLQDLMAQLSALGLRDVRGDIVLDRSVFEITPRNEAVWLGWWRLSWGDCLTISSTLRAKSSTVRSWNCDTRTQP